MRRLLVGLLLLALFVTGVPKGGGFTPQEKHFVTTAFSDGSDYKVVGLDGVPFNSSAKVNIPNNCTIENAALKISTVYNESGEYPQNLKLDIGSDGNIEYAFSGLGYGAFGKQYMFSNGRTYIDLTATGGAHPPVYYIKIPAKARVTNATLKLAPSPTTAVTYVTLNDTNCIDSRVDSFYSTRNYGTNGYLLSGSRARTHTEYAYIKFDVNDVESQLPA
ncbi:MAG: hypothetical protein J7L88_06530, partial [Thermoplasmata archaeon]|nr:hypothetical protein [Thermoplasmata archaeon]